ncbi:glycosyl transferase group 1 [Halothece sp. PCC 7418]|uniref:glycosyltransferase n=1 Tax=Halothece sp. (strain PCC 7418) TaxID=65093 RepID=UPI0002A07C7E|nr:glycosyltransferase [Halothece sp. PCC 7418]AFZ44905.1 glycosyl transferase group 1 [Halothece sp. PCC 7418]
MTRKQRLAINVLGNRNWIGGIQYTKNLVLALAHLPSEVRNQYEIFLIGNKSEINTLKELEPYVDKIFFRETDFKAATLLNRLFWKILKIFNNQNNPQLDSFLNQQEIDFIYPYFSKDTQGKAYNSATWIYDFQHKYLPDFFSNAEIQRRDENFKKIAEYSNKVVFSSQTAKKDFDNFFPNSKAKTEVLSFKTVPFQNWYELEPKKVQEKYHLPQKFFLISNQFWQHKNHLVVLEAMKFLKLHSIEPIIVCTGHVNDYRKPEYIDQILELIHCSGLAHQVYLLGLIPRLDQIQLMRRSLAVIQPSLFEGWSTVIEDARCLGKPIIMSDLEVNLEQNPPNHKVFERNSPDKLAPILADWWDKLKPGPDYEQEKRAKENNLVEVQNFAYRFLEIAQ